MRKVLFLAMLFLLVVASKCGDKKGNTFTPGKPFLLKIGETVEADDGSIMVLFSSVKEDSRCPENANCIQAGRAVIMVGAVEGRQSYTTELTLKEGKSSQRMLGQYHCSMQKLDPWPVADQRTDPESYVVTLLLEKK